MSVAAHFEDGGLYRVEWVDSVSPGSGAWIDSEEFEHPSVDDLTCNTAGWVVSQDVTSVTFAGSVNDSQYGGIITIPRSAVQTHLWLDGPQ